VVPAITRIEPRTAERAPAFSGLRIEGKLFHNRPSIRLAPVDTM
jgi:hypothetical protein